MNQDSLPGGRFQELQQGFSLLELLLVLLVLTIVVLAGFGQYRRYHKHKEIEALKHNLTVLKEAANLYYQHQCTSTEGSFKSRFESEAFNIERVKAKVPFQLLPSNLVSTIKVNDQKTISLAGYELYAEAFGSPVYLPKGTDQDHAKIILYPYRLKLKATFAEPVTNETLAWYQSVLGATDVEGKQLIWDYLPNAPKSKMGDQLWITETGLQQFKQKATKNFSAGKGVEGPVLQCAY